MADDLHSRIKSKMPQIAETLRKDFREELNANIHILDISYESLKVNVYTRKTLSNRELITYNSVYKTLIDVVKAECVGKTFASIDDPGFLPLFNSKKSVGVILIDDGPSNIFLVGKSYDSVQKFVSKYISRNPQLRATRFGATTTYKQVFDNKDRPIDGDYKVSEITKVDIGHTSSIDNPNLISPLEKKIETVLNQAIAAGNSRVTSIAQKALKDLYNIQADISYQFKNTTPENIAKAKKALGEGYIVVTMHTRKLNNRFSAIEKQIYDRLVAEIALSLKLETVPGSNSIVEDIGENITNIIAGKNKTLKKHAVRTGKVTTDISSKVKTKPLSLVLGGKLSNILPPISTVNLESLLRSRLSLQIKQNMGTGNAKNVLNYRTGRLADSASIERVSTSRAGMVSVFYNYMRNPYGTFSEGGAQQYPKTRDPKLLISKSIREIGASAMANRMRAVLV